MGVDKYLAEHGFGDSDGDEDEDEQTARAASEQKEAEDAEAKQTTLATVTHFPPLPGAHNSARDRPASGHDKDAHSSSTASLHSLTFDQSRPLTPRSEAKRARAL